MLKKLICLFLALACLGTLAFAETTEDPEARIAELEALVELYKPYYDAQVIVEYDGGVIFLDDVLEEYSYYEQMYSQSYGIDLASYGLDTQVKQQAAQYLMEEAVKHMKATELGLDALDETTTADLTAQADEMWESYIQSIAEQMKTDEQTVEDVRDDAIAYLQNLGYTQESLLEDLKHNYIEDKLYETVTADVTVTDEDIQAAYEEQIASDKESYTSDTAYNSARNSGTTIAWNPEGYRAVKHVLVKFDDDQSTRYSDLTSQLNNLNEALEEALNPTETAEATDSAEATVEPAAEETAERTAEEIQADIDSVQAELDALYEELMPTAQEVVDKFNAGESFESLIETYNGDPGMTSEPTKSQGYAVKADSTAYDAAFTEGAMSIAELGGISEPVKGAYGIYVINYFADIPAGEVPLDDIREALSSSLLDTKISETFTNAVAEWTDALHPVYHYDRLSK